VYDWSEWKQFLIVSVWPKARRVSAEFRESPHKIAERLPSKTRLLLMHLDLSLMSPFVSDANEFTAAFAKRDIRALNALPVDIRKRTIQSQCRDFGLPSVTAHPDGPPDESLIVKTNLNSGGSREQWLSPAQKVEFNLPAGNGHLKGPDDYFVSRRADLAPKIWTDPALVIERYIRNPHHRFFRVYAAMDAIVISEAFTDEPVKRMAGPIRRHNHFLWRQTEKIFGDSAASLPPRLLQTAGKFLHGIHLDYGAIDIVESETGEFFIVDLNKTPHWGDEKQRGLLEHLLVGSSADFLPNHDPMSIRARQRKFPHSPRLIRNLPDLPQSLRRQLCVIRRRVIHPKIREIAVRSELTGPQVIGTLAQHDHTVVFCDKNPPIRLSHNPEPQPLHIKPRRFPHVMHRKHMVILNNRRHEFLLSP
jgi:hypothetical protein